MDENIRGLEFTVGESKTQGSSNYSPLNEDEMYNAECVDIEIKNLAFGPVVNWIFELTDSEHTYTFTDDSGKEISGRRRVRGTSSLLCNPKTKLYNWYTKLLGSEPNVGEKISLSKVMGIKCRLLIKNTQGKKANDEGSFPIYSNVDRIIPIKSAEATQSVTKPEVVTNNTNSKTPMAAKKEEPKATTVNKEDLFEDIF